MKYFIVLIFLVGKLCCAQLKIDNITDMPKVQRADKALANVYQPLDGTWQGTFLVKQDSNPVQKPDNLQDKITMLKFIKAAKTINTIQVSQLALVCDGCRTSLVGYE